jgi:subtilisin family serine protease
MIAMPVELPNENLGGGMSTSSRTTSARLALAWIAIIPSIGCRDSLAPSARQPVFAKSVRHAAFGMQSASHRKIPDEYIVVFDESVSDVHGRAVTLASITGGTIRHEYSAALKGYSTHMSAQAADALSRHPGVDFVEQDSEVSAEEASYAAAWGIDRIDQLGLPLDGQYSFTSTGAGVNAYIIDTGVRRTHSQFGGRVVPAFSAISDGFGPDGCNGHGTHVAGTLGGATVGVAKGVSLYSVRVLDCNGAGSISSVIAGIVWVTSNRVLPAVANMSLTAEFSAALNAAVENSISSGVAFVVAAGNSASDACAYSPSSAANAITVGATTASDFEASYSNSGGCVDIFAPGTTIHSAWNSDDYAMIGLSGTSMASPHVAGAAALFLQSNPAASPQQVWQALQASATVNAIADLPDGTANRLLRVNGPAQGVVLPPPDPVQPPSSPANAAPLAAFSVSCPSQKNNCTFDGSASKDDSGIAGYRWSFGDGASSVTAASPIATHSYRSKGSYTVTLTVTDAGGLSATSQRLITVKSVAKQ